MKTYKIKYEIHFQYEKIDDGIVSINLDEKRGIEDIMVVTRTHGAGEILEAWCDNNNVDYYEDEGYSIENVALVIC